MSLAARRWFCAMSLFGPADTHDEMMSLLAEVSPRASVLSSRANLYRALARLQAQNDETDESVESWKRVLEIAATDPEALEQVGRLLGRQNRVPELIEVINSYVETEFREESKATDYSAFDDYRTNLAALRRINGMIKGYLDIDLTVKRDDIRELADSVKALQ